VFIIYVMKKNLKTNISLKLLYSSLDISFESIFKAELEMKSHPKMSRSSVSLSLLVATSQTDVLADDDCDGKNN
jgi:hypothetical protein